MCNLNDALYIKEQILKGSGAGTAEGSDCLLAWGAGPMTGSETKEGKGWLRFTVEGRKFKGAVRVAGMGAGWYHVEFWDACGSKPELVDMVDCVRYDRLTYVIDAYVEAENVALL